MNEIKGNYFLVNGSVEPIEKFEAICSQINFEVYEVIRIINGIPLFCEDHFARMMNSLQLLHKHFDTEYQSFKDQIKLLAGKNNIQNGNVKIIVSDQAKNLIMHFIPHYYPTDNDYKQGVKTGLFEAERTNPNVKTHLTELRKKVDFYIKKSGLYEILYVDRDGVITEGSRSNLFFIKEKVAYTCPPEKILLGITRQKVIQCLKNINIPLIEKPVFKNDIKSFESVFLTGTSPRILPIASIDKISFSCSNETMGKIMVEYNRMIDQYVADRKN